MFQYNNYASESLKTILCYGIMNELETSSKFDGGGMYQ